MTRARRARRSTTTSAPTTTPAPAVIELTPEQMAAAETEANAMNDALIIQEINDKCMYNLRSSWAKTVSEANPKDWRIRGGIGSHVSFRKPDGYHEYLEDIGSLCLLVASSEDGAIEVARVANTSYRSNMTSLNQSLRSEDDAQAVSDALEGDLTETASARSALFADMENYVAPVVVEEVAVESEPEAVEAVVEAVTTPDPSVVAA